MKRGGHVHGPVHKHKHRPVEAVPASCSAVAEQRIPCVPKIVSQFLVQLCRHVLGGVTCRAPYDRHCSQCYKKGKQTVGDGGHHQIHLGIRDASSVEGVVGDTGLRRVLVLQADEVGVLVKEPLNILLTSCLQCRGGDVLQLRS